MKQNNTLFSTAHRKKINVQNQRSQRPTNGQVSFPYTISESLRINQGWQYTGKQLYSYYIVCIPFFLLTKSATMTQLQQITPDILQIASRHGIGNVRIFGSFADGNAQPTSDVDLLVSPEPGRDLLDLIALKQELEERIGRRVDIVTEKGLSPHLKEIILGQAKSL